MSVGLFGDGLVPIQFLWQQSPEDLTVIRSGRILHGEPPPPLATPAPLSD